MATKQFPGWVFFPLHDSPGGEAFRLSPLKLEEVLREVDTNKQIVAFTTDGRCKGRLLPCDQWEKFPGVGPYEKANPDNVVGTYVRDSAASALSGQFADPYLQEILSAVQNPPPSYETAAAPQFSGWVFIPYHASPGNDVCHYKNKSMKELWAIAKNDQNVISFNTNGFCKRTLNPCDRWRVLGNDPTTGSYVREDAVLSLIGEFPDPRARKIVDDFKSAKLKAKEYPGWVFFPYYDSPGNDSYRIIGKSVDQIVSEIDTTEKVVAFNTNGWCKNGLNPCATWRKFSNRRNEGTYVRLGYAPHLAGHFADPELQKIMGKAIGKTPVGATGPTPSVRYSLSQSVARYPFEQMSVKVSSTVQGGGTGREFPKNLLNPQDDVWCKWYTNVSGPQTIEIETNTSIFLKMYCLTSANDVPHRDPATWTLKVKQGDQWVTLDRVTQCRFTKRYQPLSFIIPPENQNYAGTHFKLKIKENCAKQESGSWQTGTQLGLVQFFVATSK